MARITVNTTGENPTVLLSTLANGYPANGTIPSGSSVLNVICLQDLTITSTTGVFSYADFCNKDMSKLTTPGDNEIAMNVVIDPDTYFGANSLGSSAEDLGLSGLSTNKERVQFLVLWNYSGNIANLPGNAVSNTNTGSNVAWTSGYGYITNLAATAGVEAPVFVSPVSIAVDGTMYNGYTP